MHKATSEISPAIHFEIQGHHLFYLDKGILYCSRILILINFLLSKKFINIVKYTCVIMAYNGPTCGQLVAQKNYNQSCCFLLGIFRYDNTESSIFCRDS